MSNNKEKKFSDIYEEDSELELRLDRVGMNIK